MSVPKTVDTICPGCGADVLEAGFDAVSETRRSYMKFNGTGVVRIATAEKVAPRARCFKCNAELAVSAADLMRAAA